MFAMKTALDIRDTLDRVWSDRRQRVRFPEWAGMAVPFIKKYPDDPLDSEKMRDEIVSYRRSRGFVDRLIHGTYFSEGKTTVACEKSFKKLPLSEVFSV